MKSAFKIAAALIAILTLGAVAVHAADHVDASAKTIKASMGQRPSLLASYEKGASLTPQQMAVVYFGQAFTPGYKQIDKYPDIDAAYSAKDVAKALPLIEKALATNPVALNQLFRAYACTASSTSAEQKAKADNYQKRIDAICTAIFASGTGVSDSSPFITLSKEDSEAFVRNYLQPEAIIGQASIGSLDAIKVKWPGQSEDVIFYFSRPK